MTVKRHAPRPGPVLPMRGGPRGARECLDCTGTLYRPTPSLDVWAHWPGYTRHERPRAEAKP